LSANVDQFLKFFHRHIWWKNCTGVYVYFSYVTNYLVKNFKLSNFQVCR